MKFNQVVVLAFLGFAAQGEAFNFGKILGTTARTMNGASSLINTFINAYKDDGIVCPGDQFKAKVLSTGALCQLENNAESIAACREFGRDCISIPGEWGCGILDEDPDRRRSCLFRPSRAPNGVKFPKILFDHDDDDINASYGSKDQYVFKSGSSKMGASMEDGEYDGASDFYARTLVTDLERYSDIFDESEVEEGQSVVLSTTAIVKALDLAGFRYPIGKAVCQVCKGVCNKIMSGDNIDRCKYDACVKFLGGYKGTEAIPSCDLISLP
ncbi:hypothetical protein BGX30_014373 [Mortierella sp. GBA39]|nr:hypothetical protein BGX30_014373 [Mortierella sp. GBA39]